MVDAVRLLEQLREEIRKENPDYSERSLNMNKQVTVINPNSSDFWRKFYEIVSPDIDKFFTYYCSYSETCFDIYYKGERINSLIFNKNHNQFEWVDDDMPITFWGCDKEIKKSISNAFKQLLGGKASDLCKSLKLKR